MLTESVLETARDPEWEGNVKIGLKEMGNSYADWIDLARICTGDGCCKHINPLKPELNPICYLLALLGAHHFLHVSKIRVKSLTIRLLMSYIYMEHLFLMFLDHTQRRSTVGRTPLDE